MITPEDFDIIMNDLERKFKINGAAQAEMPSVSDGQVGLPRIPSLPPTSALPINADPQADEESVPAARTAKAPLVERHTTVPAVSAPKRRVPWPQIDDERLDDPRHNLANYVRTR